MKDALCQRHYWKNLMDFRYFGKSVGTVNNERIRLYAIGIFQKFNSTDQTKLIIHTFVDYGLYFNIIQPDLEQFYLEKAYPFMGLKI